MTVIINSTRNRVLARRGVEARTPWARLMGLMWRKELPEDAALVLAGTKGVHTHFMRFPIDVVFYDTQGRVIDVIHSLRSWRFSKYCLAAAGAIELPAGVVAASGTVPGDCLTFARD